MKIKIFNKEFYKKFPLPSYQTKGSAGLDLRVITDEPEIYLNPNEVRKFSTGLGIFLKNDKYVALIYPRSGLGSKGLILGNTVGVIDSDYQGEIFLSIWNRSHEKIKISNGDRVAQLLFQKVKKPLFDIVEEYEETTARNVSGFGSTGTK